MSRRKALGKAVRRLSRRVLDHYLLVLLALAGSGLVLLTYYLWGGTSGDLWPNIAAELIATPWIFVIVYLFVVLPGVSLPRMADGHDTGALVGFSPTHDSVDWGGIIRGARRLDIIVHYYDAWVRDYHTEFTTFFQRGGAVRLILPDPDIDEVMQTVQREFFPRHKVERLREKVLDTEKYLREAYTEASSTKAKLEVYAFPGALHYAAVIKDERHIYLSVYEQFRGATIGAQVFHMDGALDPELGEYWKGTVTQFVAASRPFGS